MREALPIMHETPRNFAEDNAPLRRLVGRAQTFDVRWDSWLYHPVCAQVCAATVQQPGQIS